MSWDERWPSAPCDSTYIPCLAIFQTMVDPRNHELRVVARPKSAILGFADLRTAREVHILRAQLLSGARNCENEGGAFVCELVPHDEIGAQSSPFRSLEPCEGLVASGDLCISHASCGAGHCVLLTHGGSAYVMGSNSHGQLGISQEPAGERSVARLRLGRRWPFSVSITAVAAGEAHTVLATKGGRVFTCGRMDRGCLGRECSLDESRMMGQVGFGRGRVFVTKLACGSRHTLAATDSGELVRRA